MASRIRALVALLSLVVAASASSQPVGFIADVKGTANIQPVDAPDWQPAAIDNTVSLGDAVSTGPDSTVRILLVDDTTLLLAANTEMVVDRMIVGDLATQERSILRQLRGQVRANVGQAFGGTTRLEIHTPTAVAGVKGSTMEILVRRRDTIACNAEGQMFVRNIDDRIGGEIDLPMGMCTTVLEGVQPEPPEIYPSGFPAIAMPARTQVASAAIDALVTTGAGVGTDDVEPAEIGDGPRRRKMPNGSGDSEETFDGGFESLTPELLDGLRPAPPDIPVIIIGPGDPR